MSANPQGVGVGCSDESDVIGDEIAVHGPRDVLEFGNFKFIELDGGSMSLGAEEFVSYHLARGRIEGAMLEHEIRYRDINVER